MNTPHTRVREVRRFKTGRIECYAMFIDGKQVGPSLCERAGPYDAELCDAAARKYADQYGRWPDGQKHVVMWGMGGKS